MVGQDQAENSFFFLLDKVQAEDIETTYHCSDRQDSLAKTYRKDVAGALFCFCSFQS